MVDVAQPDALYLVPSTLIIVVDHFFSQCQVYCVPLITVEKHDFPDSTRSNIYIAYIYVTAIMLSFIPE